MSIWKKVTGFFKWAVANDEPVKKQKNEKIVEEAIKSGELKLDKFETAPVVKTKPKRARTKKGTYVADDESTPDVNEAWVGGEAPKSTYKKPKQKKTKVTRVKKK